MKINKGLQKWIEQRRRNLEIPNFIVNDIHYYGNCIYKITNLTINKVYIGETVNYHRRVNVHRCGLLNNNHFCKKLLEDYNNGHKFKMEILEKLKNSTQKQQRIIEGKYINKYNNKYNKLIFTE